MKQKPEISWDYVNKCFLRDEKPIFYEEVLEHWHALDADWTAGAYTQAANLANGRQLE